MMAMEEYFSLPSSDWGAPHPASGAGDLLLHEQAHFWSLCSSKGASSGSSGSSQASTGYLQDAVAECSGRSKRRRRSSSSSYALDYVSAEPPPPPPMMTSEELQDLIRGFWDSSCCGDPLLVVDGGDVEMNEEELKSHVFSSSEVGDLRHRPKPRTTSASEAKALPSAVVKLGGCEGTGNNSKRTTTTAETKKERTTSVAYPFAVVKPGGGEGDVTLDDINARILMRPRRPVRHPVGEYARGPRRVSPAGQGLSGRAVVGLTRIQTQGRGTITIIRTK